MGLPPDVLTTQKGGQLPYKVINETVPFNVILNASELASLEGLNIREMKLEVATDAGVGPGV
jgi:hypothetical protein